MAAPMSTPWTALMESQAQAVNEPPEASLAQLPAMTEDEVLQAVESGELDPSQPVRLIARTPGKQSVSMRIKGPVQQNGSQPYDQMMRELADQYGVKSKEALLAQQQGISQLEDNINQARSAPRGLDLTPFASMAKFLNPENDFVREAQMMKPESAQQREEKLIGLQNMLQQRKENMSKQQLESLKEQINAYKASKVDPLEMELKLSRIAANNALAGQKADGKIMPETSIQKISDFDASLKELHDMAENFGKYKNTMGPIKGRIASINEFDTHAQSFQADVDRARQVIGKAVEGGVLRKEDEAKYMKMLPVLKDTPEVAAYKMKQFANKMSVARNSYLSNMKNAGYNTKNISEVTEVESANRPQYKEGDVVDHGGKKFKLVGEDWVQVK